MSDITIDLGGYIFSFPVYLLARNGTGLASVGDEERMFVAVFTERDLADRLALKMQDNVMVGEVPTPEVLTAALSLSDREWVGFDPEVGRSAAVVRRLEVLEALESFRNRSSS